jgi:hypothetical protein
MAWQAHDPEGSAAEGRAIKPGVARDFNQADKGSKLLKMAMMAKALRVGGGSKGGLTNGR